MGLSGGMRGSGEPEKGPLYQGAERHGCARGDGVVRCFAGWKDGDVRAEVLGGVGVGGICSDNQEVRLRGAVLVARLCALALRTSEQVRSGTLGIDAGWGVGQAIVMPPSTMRVWPVKKPASSLVA